MDAFIAIFPSTVAAIAAVAAAYISSRNKAEAEQSARETKDYREKRERIDTAKWQVLLSTMEGVTVLLHHAKGEKLNGNVEAALNGIEEAKDELTKVQIETLVKE